MSDQTYRYIGLCFTHNVNSMCYTVFFDQCVNENEVVDRNITPYDVGSALWRLFSTLEVVQYIGGITSVLWGDSFSTVGG